MKVSVIEAFQKDGTTKMPLLILDAETKEEVNIVKRFKGNVYGQIPKNCLGDYGDTIFLSKGDRET